MKAKQLFIFSIFLVILTGCQNNSSKRNLDDEQKIYIHETTKNYGGLIDIYKDRLKHSDTVETRFKLAQVYFLSSDYDASIKTLNPIIDKTQDDNALALYGRNLSKKGKYKKALAYLEKAHSINPKNGEVLNLLGIVQIRLGQYDAARNSFEKSREMFYDENKILNNLAMLDILGKNYLAAYKNLNILYKKGYRNNALLHNLLYTLVKLDRIDAAKQLCMQHKLSNQPVILIQELKKVEPAVHVNKLVPDQDEMKSQYAKEKDKLVTADPAKTVNTVNNVKQQPASPVPTNTGNNQKNTTPVVNSTTGKAALIAIRSGEHKSFSRITFETSKLLSKAQYDIKDIGNNHVQITLSDIELMGTTVEQIIKRISKSDRNFTNISAKYNADKSLVIDIQIKNVSNFRAFYAGKEKGDCLAFDFNVIN